MKKTFISLIAFAILTLSTSCSITRNSKKNESTQGINSYVEVSTSNIADSLYMQSARINKLMQEQSSIKLIIETMREHINTLENTNIQEKEYYESGAIKSERTVETNKQVTQERETIKSLQEQLNTLTLRLDSTSNALKELQNMINIVETQQKSSFIQDIKSDTQLKSSDPLWKGLSIICVALLVLFFVYLLLKKYHILK
jgi:uncharacterized coiled-coil protein SlyX